MTLKNLYFKLIKQELKNKIWCPIIVFISFFLILEVQILMQLQEMERWPKNYPYTPTQYVVNKFLTLDGNYLFTIATVVAAILCGLVGFAYVHSRQKLDTYHSLPVGRNTFFFARYTAGVLYYLVPCIIHLLICLVIAYGKGAFSLQGIHHLIGLLGTELVVFLLCYSMTIICIMLTGNLVISVLAVAILQSYSLLIWLLKNILYEKFYYTVESSYIGSVWAFSPLHMIYNLVSIATEYRAEVTEFSYHAIMSYVLMLVGVTVLFTMIGLWLYRKRPTEAAGRTIAFGITEPVIKCLIVIPFSLFSGSFFTMIGLQSDFAWYIFGIAFGFIMCCLFLEIVFRRDMKAVFHHWQHIVFNAACVVLIILVFDNDALGYNTYVPAKEEVDSCSVSIEGLLETNYYYVNGMWKNYRLENMELKGNDAVLELAQKLASEGLHYKEYDNYYEGLYETPEYKATALKEENYRSIIFGYHLTNGKKIYRRYFYDISDEESRKLVGEIFDDIDYKLGSAPIFTTGWNREIKEVYCLGHFDEKTLFLDQNQQNKLMDVYQREYMKLTFDDVMQNMPIGTLNFYFEDQKTTEGIFYSNSYYENGCIVYPQFVNTIALLKEYGFDFIDAQMPQIVEEIKVTNYEYCDYQYSQGPPRVIYTDEEKLLELVQSVAFDGITDSGKYMPVDCKYDVTITYSLSSGSKQTQYFIFRKGQIPDFVEEDMRSAEEAYDLAIKE